jgi:3-hydroxyisobutyrate dehydrogenase-like beta-hydroxyacid dehydrogenase
MNIAFIGLGAMGRPMAEWLLSEGFALKVSDVNPQLADVFGSAWAASPAEAAQDADVVITMLPNGKIVRDVLLGSGGVAGVLKAGTVVVYTSSSDAAGTSALGAELAPHGIALIDAPVSGGQAGAQNGALTVMCGGDAQAFARVQAVAMAFSKAVTLLGSSGSGQLAKMVNQIAIAGLVQGLSEAVAFGQRAGLDMNQVLEVISKGAAQSWQMDNRGKTMVADKFDFGFAVDWMRKDLGLVLDEAKRNGARLPVTALVDQFYADVQQTGGGRWDTSSLIKRLR